MSEEIKIPVKLIIYKDMIDTIFNMLVPVDKADEFDVVPIDCTFPSTATVSI